MPYDTGNLDHFAQFQRDLTGTWENRDFPGSHEGGNQNPLSYNVMPLPQDAVQAGGPQPYAGYILKNFSYYETARFNDEHANLIATPATAPNRGGGINQNAHAIFYDQRVRFAEPHEHAGQVVHVENGAWLYLDRAQQEPGPFADPEPPPQPGMMKQPADLTVAKQIAVPHGNSVLALGHFDTLNNNPVIPGAPMIPDAAPPYPTPRTISTERYTTQLDTQPDYENPQVDRTLNPNLVLQRAVNIIKPDSYMHWRVTTRPLRDGRGHVTNIPFEQRRANVTDYWADYWLLGKGGHFKYLAYTQTMLMEMKIRVNGTEKPYSFPHVTSNTVTKI